MRATFDDPLLALTRARSHHSRWLLGAIGVATIVHVVTAWAVPRLVHRSAAKIAMPVIDVVDIDIPPPPPQAPPEPEEAPQKEPEPSKAAEPLQREAAPREAAHTPPPSRAEAAAVMTQAPEPNEPLDLTGGFVTGTAATYAGGSTSSTGTSAVAVRQGSVASVAAPTETRRAPAAPSAERAAGPDRSRKPSLGDGAAWQCPFPSEADAAQVDHAMVTIRVEVAATGAPTSVMVTGDPGNGFGREARRCALGRTWSPALARDGSPTNGTTVVKVRFDR